jgi:iron complex transport system substrate-binding protein
VVRTRTSKTRRHRWLLAAVVAVAAATTACGSSGDDGDDAAPEPAAAVRTVAVEHRYGPTELDAVPERIVSLDLQWTDVLLAMGVQPVGFAAPGVEDPSGRYPWQTDLAEAATFLQVGVDELPFEQIAALHPDLIVVSWEVTDRAGYEKLAAIAPTIGMLAPDGAQVDDWQDMTTTAGQFLRQPAKAEQVVDGVQDRIAALAADLPALAGKTFTLSQYLPGDGIYVVADPDDGSSRFFRDLGLVMAPDVAAAGTSQGVARPTFSAERVDILGADVVVFFSPVAEAQLAKELPGYDDLPAIRTGALVNASFPLIVALNTPTPLSVDYALEQLRPALAAAAGKT